METVVALEAMPAPPATKSMSTMSHLSETDSMNSLGAKMNNRCSKKEGNVKISEGNTATAATEAKSSNRCDRIMKRSQVKKKEAKRKYAKERYANKSTEQKKEDSEKHKQQYRAKLKKTAVDHKKKMTAEGKLVAPKVDYHPQIPKMNYETIQTNIVDPKIIPSRLITRKCDCASSGKTDCVSGDCKNATRTLWNQSESMICPIECTPANCSFGEKQCKNKVLTDEQHIRNCFPRKQDSNNYELCATTEIPKGCLIGQYMGIVSKKGKLKRTTSNYVVELRSPGYEKEQANLWLDGEVNGNLTRFINHSCAPNCELEQRQVNGMETGWIRTISIINKKKPLTIGYGTNASQFFTDRVCKCGETCCEFVK